MARVNCFNVCCVTGLLLGTIGILEASQNQAVETPRVVVERLDGAIKIDGVLDEGAWQKAGVIPNFIQQSPRPGVATPYRTEVRLLLDDDTLYIGVTCLDPEPNKIAVHTLQRDGELFSDDHITFVLDTFGDRRSGYIFRVNAAGARQDGLITPSGGGAEYGHDGGGEWDGIWHAAARITKEGWTTEIAIPSRTLRFAKGVDTWGFNIERTVPREHMDLRWTAITLDATLSDLRRAGELAGVGKLRQGLGLSISPHALGRTEKDFVTKESHSKGEGGLDVAYSLGTQLSAVLTLKTDFAETEVDTRQINLTRFSLFFPEKRQFFTDGSNQFDFGTGLDSSFIPFFSRRVGLYDGEQIPILGGLKLVGRQGPFGIGVLDVQTDDSSAAPSTNLFAGRFTYDIDDHLRVGVIATRGNPDGESDNTLAGVDAVWQTSSFRGDKNLSMGAWFASSSGDGPKGNDNGYGFRVAYPNDLISASLTYREFGDALNPALGFLPRPGTRSYVADFGYNPRPKTGWWSTWVRQFRWGAFPEVVTNLDGKTESWAVYTSIFNVETHSGERIETMYTPQYEYLSQPFEISDGVVIPAGKYRFDRYSVELETSSHRNWKIGTDASFGTFYNGTMQKWEQSLSYNSSNGRLQLTLEAENAWVHLPQGNFVERLLLFKAVYSFSPNVVLSAFTQYDTDSRNLGINTRLRWTLTPGTDLYVVWNHGWQRPFDEDRWSTFKPASDQAIVKLRYTWRP